MLAPVAERPCCEVTDESLSTAVRQFSDFVAAQEINSAYACNQEWSRIEKPITTLDLFPEVGAQQVTRDP